MTFSREAPALAVASVVRTTPSFLREATALIAEVAEEEEGARAARAVAPGPVAARCRKGERFKSG